MAYRYLPLLFTLLSMPLHAEEITYSRHIRPLWEQRCASCHGANSPETGAWQLRKDDYKRQMLGPRMDSYATLLHYIGWPQTGALMRQLDDGLERGKPGGMYVYLGEDEAERQRNLAVFRAWIGKEELERLRLAY